MLGICVPLCGRGICVHVHKCYQLCYNLNTYHKDVLVV